jgi:hypothetical protein
MVRYIFLALLAGVSQAAVTFGQPGASGDSEGGGGAQLSVGVTATPNPIVMGYTATFDATADTPQPSPAWMAKCSGCANNMPYHSLSTWTGMTISECIGEPGTYEYRCKVSDLATGKSPGVGLVNIVVKPADNATFSLTPSTRAIYTPNTNPPMSGFIQTAKLDLRCGNIPVGPCSIVCATETITTVWRNKALLTKLGWPSDYHVGRVGKWPLGCMSQAWGNTVVTSPSVLVTSIPNGYTWDWNPPTLTDRWGFDLTQQQYVNLLATVQVGDVLIRQHHLYSFDFDDCCGNALFVKRLVPKQLVVEMVGSQKGLVWEAF